MLFKFFVFSVIKISVLLFLQNFLFEDEMAFKLSSISSSLPPEARARYVNHKLTRLNVDCPYSIEEERWSTDEGLIAIMPEVLLGDIDQYLVHTHKLYSEGQVKAYKSLDSYRRVEEGLVGSVKGLSLPNGFVILKGKVKFSIHNFLFWAIHFLFT